MSTRRGVTSRMLVVFARLQARAHRLSALVDMFIDWIVDLIKHIGRFYEKDRVVVG